MLARQAPVVDAAPKWGKAALMENALLWLVWRHPRGCLGCCDDSNCAWLPRSKSPLSPSDDSSNETRSSGRLKAIGVRTLQGMNLTGIVIDISHLNDSCSLNAIEVAEKSIVRRTRILAGWCRRTA